MDIVTYALLNGKIKDYASNVDEWLEENVDPATGYVLDRSLQMENAAAPADIVGDISNEVGDLKNTLNHKADVIYDTASGDIASFPDGADGLPVKDLTVSIEPVQSGTGDPSPTNVRPISGWTGCSVADISDSAKQPYFAGLLDGTYGFVDLGTLDWSYGTSANHKIFYTTSALDNANNGAACICPKYVEVPLNTIVYDENSNMQICIGWAYVSKAINITDSNYSTAEAFKTAMSGVYLIYELATPTTPSITLAQYNTLLTAFNLGGWLATEDWSSIVPGGTVCGGTLDVTSGVLTVTDANIASYNGETLPGEWISDRDVYAAGATPTTGAQVVYKLATPQTYQLTPEEVTTLLGQNNIFADCGPSTVEYPADTKLYIQKINTPTDDDMIADANIASGQYFIVNNNLYISTAAILAGDPIKPGTNCTLTNIAAALNALNS